MLPLLDAYDDAANTLPSLAATEAFFAVAGINALLMLSPRMGASHSVSRHHLLMKQRSSLN